MKLLIIVALSAWLAVMAFFGFIVAPTAFATLDREPAGRLVTAVMPGYLWLGLGLGLTALAGSAWRLRQAARSGAGWLGVTLVLVAVLATLGSLLVLLPEARSLAPAVRAWRLSGGPPPPEALRFATLHRLSSLANLVALIAVAASLALEAWRASRKAGRSMTAPVGFEPRGLDHVVLRVRDQQRAQRFYVEILGCRLEHVNPAASLIQLRFGEHLIDLLPGEPGPAGMDHLCLSVRCADLGAVRDALASRGVVIEGELRERRGAFGTGASLYVRDPDGYLIEIKPR